MKNKGVSRIEKQRMYLCADLKSFYASVECIERGLNPMNTNLVVADVGKTEKTICLAVSPSLKEYGIPGRARLFEVMQKVKQANSTRRRRAPGQKFCGQSYLADELKQNPALELSYIAAPPRMALYMEYSTRIYNVYLKYIAPEDIHVYSIDEVFIDITEYLTRYKLTPRELAQGMIKDVLKTAGITATAGIGPNLYLAKIAMDIMAKHTQPDENGARIAELDEISYRRSLWSHRPMTDFWRIGRGYQRRLESAGMLTMGDVARCSLKSEDVLYQMFGVNAELLIDHAWGWEPCTMAEIKAYRPESSSISSGQVLSCPYDYDKTRIIVREMTELMALDLVDKGLVTDQIVLSIGYDIENLSDPDIRKQYSGEVVTDRYGRSVPKEAHGSANLPQKTASTRLMMGAVMELYERIVNPKLLTRRLSITANHVIDARTAAEEAQTEQLSLFTDYEREQQQKVELEKEKRMQQAMLKIKKQFGKNAILKGTNLQEGATTVERNGQIGGHKA